MYRSCAGSCSYSCASIAADATCADSECVEGCACPEGMALDSNDDCVPINQCPCEFSGKYHSAGTGVMIGEQYW